MKFHRGLPELRTKKWETTLGSQRARGWKSKNSLLDFLGLGGSRIFNRGTGSNLLPITLYEVRYLPIIPWNTMEYFKNHFCASVAFSSVVIWFFCAYSLYDFPTQAKDSLKRQQRKIEDGWMKWRKMVDEKYKVRCKSGSIPFTTNKDETRPIGSSWQFSF